MLVLVPVEVGGDGDCSHSIEVFVLFGPFSCSLFSGRPFFTGVGLAATDFLGATAIVVWVG